MATIPNTPPPAEPEDYRNCLLMRCEFCDFYCKRSEPEEMEKHQIEHFEGPEEKTT
jgi:hypothetical protein